MLRWQGVAPTPPSLTEAVEELAATVEELHAMHEDLTTSQQAALENQRRYQELFDGVPEPYLVTDVHGLIQEANGPAIHLFHLDRVHLTGLPLAVWVVPEQRAAFRAQLAWLQHGAERREWRLRVQPRHHPPVSVVCHVAPTLDVEGRLIGLRWLLRDHTTSPTEPEAVEPHERARAAELARANAALQAQLDRAELRARELHHRMNNHLQVVASLLEWRTGDLADPRMRAIVRECQGRVRAMALIHEHLYRAGDRERLELGAYLRRLALLLCEVYGVDRARRPLTVQAEPVEVALHTGLACGLLVHEMLSNALQQDVPDDRLGAVGLTLRAEAPGEVTLTILDPGVDGLATRAGTFESHLIQALAEQLQGTLRVTRDQGTRVILRFPL
jgi:two-component sensor histidine kinase